MAAWLLLLYRQFRLRMVYDRQAFQQDPAKASVILEEKNLHPSPKLRDHLHTQKLVFPGTPEIMETWNYKGLWPILFTHRTVSALPLRYSLSSFIVFFILRQGLS